jgi:hypothetical protein
MLPAGGSAQMPDYYYLVLVDDDGLAPAVGFDRGSDFGDGAATPFAGVLRVVFGAIDVPHLDLHLPLRRYFQWPIIRGFREIVKHCSIRSYPLLNGSNRC